MNQSHVGDSHPTASEDTTTRVMIVDQDLFVRSTLSETLPCHGDITVSSIHSYDEDAVASVGAETPHVVLLGTGTPKALHVELTRSICVSFPCVKVLVLTSGVNHPAVDQIFQAGAVGCLVKDTPIEMIAHAIEAARHGLVVMSPVVRPPVPSCETPELSNIERHVMRLTCQGLTNAQIAMQLGISPSAAKHHLSRILKLLDAPNRARLAYLAGEGGWC